MTILQLDDLLSTPSLLARIVMPRSTLAHVFWGRDVRQSSFLSSIPFSEFLALGSGGLFEHSRVSIALMVRTANLARPEFDDSP
jgi:hypothetical protein